MTKEPALFALFVVEGDGEIVEGSFHATNQPIKLRLRRSSFATTVRALEDDAAPDTGEFLCSDCRAARSRAQLQCIKEEHAMTEETYTTDAEKTRIIKAALREGFPNCKFSVTRGGAQIEWADDGPEVAAVEDVVLATNVAVVRDGWDGRRRAEIPGNWDSNWIYFCRYNAAERAADQQDSERRRAEYEDRCARTNATLAAAVRTKNEALRALRHDPPKPDEFKLQAAYDGFEALRQRVEAAVAIEAERSRRPSWAPPLTLDGELLELCCALGYLRPDVAAIARLWAMYADPKGSGRVLRERLSAVPLFGIECRGFQLFAGSERGSTSELLFEAQRTPAGIWRFGPELNAGGHFYPSHGWQRLTHARFEVEDRRERGEAWPDDQARLDRLTQEIAEIDARDLAATTEQQKFAGQRNRALELARERVLSFVGEPDAQMQLAARLWGHCCICGKTLTDPLSLERGIGPDCRQELIEFICACATEPAPWLVMMTGMPADFVIEVINENTDVAVVKHGALL